MAQKKRRPATGKIDPSAISLRSGYVGWCTLLFDESNLKKLNDAGFNLLDVAWQKKPKPSFDKIRRWAGRGTWMAVASHPEISDSDGVPSLDLLFTDKGKTKPTAPKKGHWFDPVTQFLDLPTGRLFVVYEPEFFGKGYDQQADQFEISGRKDENLNNNSYAESASYVIDCEPGLYRATSFTRFLDEDLDVDVSPELVIYLAPAKKPKSFRMSDAILPIHPAGQDMDALRRASKGLPPKKKRPEQKPRLLKNGEYLGGVRSGAFINAIQMPNSLQKKFGIEAGLLVSLKIEDMELTGVIVDGVAPDPTSWDLIEKEKRKAGNFATFHPKEDILKIEVVKRSRKAPFKFPEFETATGRLGVLRDRSGIARIIATKQSAVGNDKAIEIPRRVGKPGPCVAKLIPQMEKCFAWTQYCLFEVDGKTMIGGINVTCPIHGKDIDGDDFTIPEEIAASIAEFIDGGPANETTQNFRGWPDGVGRAFQWIAKQAKGGSLWNNRFELELDFWGIKKPLMKQQDAEKDAIEAWKEVFGLL